MSDTVTLIVTATPNPDEPEAMKAYLEGVFPILEKAGGEVVRRVSVVKPVIGEQTFLAAMVMEFPSVEAIDAAFASDAYKALIPDRDKGFSKLDAVVTRTMQT